MRHYLLLWRESDILQVKKGRAGGNGGAGGAIAPPIFLKVRENVAFSTPNISRLVHGASLKVISTPNILHLPPGLGSIKSSSFEE